MDGKLWAQVYQTVMNLDHTECTTRTRYSDRVIALLVLRTVRIASAQLCPPVMMKLSPTPSSRRPRKRIVIDTPGRLAAIRDSK